MDADFEASIKKLTEENNVILQDFESQPPIDDASVYQVVPRSRQTLIRELKDFIRKAGNKSYGLGFKRNASNCRFLSLPRVGNAKGSEMGITQASFNKVLTTAKSILNLLRENMRIDTRQLLHTHYKMYQKDQEQCDACVDDLCVIFKCTLESFHLGSPDDGKVYGSLIIHNLNDPPIDCNARDGAVIPRDFRRLKLVNDKNAAKFILVVESEAMLSQLVSAGFHNTYSCILMTGRGYPGLGSRAFLNIMWRQLRLPVFGLFDCDHSGIQQFAVYKWGSKSMCFDNARLATPGIRYLGIWPSDISNTAFLFGDPCLHDSFMPVDSITVRNLYNLAARPCFKENFLRWSCEFNTLLRLNVSLNMAALNNIYFDIYRIPTFQ